MFYSPSTYGYLSIIDSLSVGACVIFRCEWANDADILSISFVEYKGNE